MIATYLLFIGKYVHTTEQPFYMRTLKHSKWMLWVGFIRPIVVDFGHAIASFGIFMAIFSGIFLSLDLEFLLDWVIWIKDFLIKLNI